MKKYLCEILVSIMILFTIASLYFMLAKEEKIFVDNIYTDVNVGLIEGVEVKLDMEYKYHYFRGVEDVLDEVESEINDCVNIYFYAMKCNKSFDTVLRGHLIGYFKSKGYEVTDIVVETSYKISDFWFKGIKWNRDNTKFMSTFVNMDLQDKCDDCKSLNESIDKLVKRTIEKTPYDSINKDSIMDNIVKECSKKGINVINRNITINEYTINNK